MQANGRITELTETQVAETLLDNTKANDIIQWVMDLIDARYGSIASFIADHEEAGILMDLLMDYRPDLVWADEDYLAADAADAAYDSWRDERLMEE